MSGSTEQQIDVGGGDIPVTTEDVRLFETQPDSKPVRPGEESSDAGSSSAADVKPDRQRAESANDDEAGADDRYSQSQTRQRRERQRQARQRSEAELQALRNEVTQLRQMVVHQQAGSIGAAVESLDAQFAQIRAEFQRAEQRYAAAVANSDGDAAVRAMADRDAALERARAVEARRAQAANAAEQMRRAPVPQRAAPMPDQAPVAPEVVEYGRNFMKDHPWYDLKGEDRDSQLVGLVDMELTSQGYNPRTPEYWEELRERVKETLPHRFNGATQQNNTPSNSNARRGPPVSGPGAAPSRRSEPDPLTGPRIEAMKQAGIWDDPERRARAIARYREYDKQQGAR